MTEYYNKIIAILLAALLGAFIAAGSSVAFADGYNKKPGRCAHTVVYVPPVEEYESNPAFRQAYLVSMEDEDGTIWNAVVDNQFSDFAPGPRTFLYAEAFGGPEDGYYMNQQTLRGIEEECGTRAMAPPCLVTSVNKIDRNPLK